MIVIESSVMVEALITNPTDPTLVEFISDHELHAPTLLDFEVASALRGLALSQKLERSRMMDAISEYQVFRVHRYPMLDSLHEILRLRDSFTCYDAAYVVLAKSLDAPLLTSDQKMKTAEKIGVEVRLLESSRS